tara:strand:- start:920 stop:1219 length:300 start_codon:yes stop_codon:yes gene_type:complete
MNIYWTSKVSINGLKHFAVVNHHKEKGKYVYLMVSLLDSLVNFEICKNELEQSSKWEAGLIDYGKENVLIDEYKDFTLKKRQKNLSIIFVNETSPFNIS